MMLGKLCQVILIHCRTQLVSLLHYITGHTCNIFVLASKASFINPTQHRQRHELLTYPITAKIYNRAFHNSEQSG